MISGSRATLSMTVVPSRQHGRHHQVLGRADRREVEPQVGAAQAAGHLGDDLPVLDAYDGAELLEPEDVHVQAARADRVATGQGHAGAATPGDERAQHGDRGPEAAYELVGGLVLELLRHVDRRAPGGRLAGRVGVAGVGDLDGAAELAQQLAHHGDVEDVRARCGSPSVPGASSEAAISFSAEFFAPPTWTVPDSGRVSGPSETTRKLPTSRHSSDAAAYAGPWST